MRNTEAQVPRGDPCCAAAKPGPDVLKLHIVVHHYQ